MNLSSFIYLFDVFNLYHLLLCSRLTILQRLNRFESISLRYSPMLSSCLNDAVKVIPQSWCSLTILKCKYYEFVLICKFLSSHMSIYLSLYILKLFILVNLLLHLCLHHSRSWLPSRVLGFLRNYLNIPKNLIPFFPSCVGQVSILLSGF